MYSFDRIRYIHDKIKDEKLFSSVQDTEIIPKTACFFSDKLDVYIDTSDGVNDDLEIQEYCGRMLACIRMSQGKKFVYFKCASSPKWSRNISELAKNNNGEVIPFFKWSFNKDFFDTKGSERKELTEKVKKSKIKYDAGLFADFSKVYKYPHPSSNSEYVSCEDISKFKLEHILGKETSTKLGFYSIDSRSNILSKLQSDKKLNIFYGSLNYKDYMQTSTECASVVNPPGIGEYTSRMMDQASIGNLIILRKNSYDQGNSWKDYFPEVDFNSAEWRQEYQSVLDDRILWQEKIKYYYDELWSPKAVYDFFFEKIKNNL